jgi:hypothetical protein
VFEDDAVRGDDSTEGEGKGCAGRDAVRRDGKLVGGGVTFDDGGNVDVRRDVGDCELRLNLVHGELW